jgi:hypothetical protein
MPDTCRRARNFSTRVELTAASGAFPKNGATSSREISPNSLTNQTARELSRGPCFLPILRFLSYFRVTPVGT